MIMMSFISIDKKYIIFICNPKYLYLRSLQGSHLHKILKAPCTREFVVLPRIVDSLKRILLVLKQQNLFVRSFSGFLICPEKFDEKNIYQ